MIVDVAEHHGKSLLPVAVVKIVDLEDERSPAIIYQGKMISKQ